MDDLEVKNACIKRTELGYEDHGIMTFWLHLTYGDSSGQGCGGWALDDVNPSNRKDRFPTKEGLFIIMRILQTVGVNKWEELPGHIIRVKASRNCVEAIAHPLKDNWFYFRDAFKEV